MLSKFPLVIQPNQLDCAPACIKMMLKHYNVPNGISFEALRINCLTNENGTEINNFTNAINEVGLNAKKDFVEFEALSQFKTPIILFVDGNHYLILYKTKNDRFYIADPAKGRVILTSSELKKRWLLKDNYGAVILVAKSEKSNSIDQGKVSKSHFELSFKSLYLKILSFKKGVRLILLLVFLASAIQLIIPFLTQSVVDTGINNNDVNFIYIILIAQFALFVGSISIDFIRRWILFHIGLRINIDLAKHFANGILSKKLSYFENKKEGDFLQRIIDNNRVELFLTDTTLSLFTATLNLFLFGAILLYYSTSIFIVFLVATVMSIVWISFFMKRRKKLDNKRFEVSAKSRSELLEMINGITDIKLNQLQAQKLKKWELVQQELLKVRMKMLELGQIQSGGAIGINQAKNILITFLSATSVIAGEMTIGEMLAVQFITGQLNSPVREIVGFIQSIQDAQLSMDRLTDVMTDENNEPAEIPQNNLEVAIEIKNVSYQRSEKLIINDVSMSIPFGAKIGIVGESGSGKTTLLKAIAKLLPIHEGQVLYGGINYEGVNAISNNISSVFQDSFIFSDSITYNITLTKETKNIDIDRLKQVTKHSFLEDLIQELPMKYKTQIGKGGKGLSRGQEQRILIARALYKNANYLLLDEFTNSLDNLTKRKIIDTIYHNYSNRTIISVAHKLEDLAYVEHIYLLSDGKIIEHGSHDELIALNNHYKALYQ